MPVPGEIIFGPARDGKQMTFERVRGMTEQEQIVELKTLGLLQEPVQ